MTVSLGQMFPPRQHRKTARIRLSRLGNIVKPTAAFALSRRGCSPLRHENHVSSGEEDSNKKEYREDEGRHDSDNEQYSDDHNLSKKEETYVKSNHHPRNHFPLSDKSSNELNPEPSDTKDFSRISKKDEPQPEPVRQGGSERNSILQSKFTRVKQPTTVQLTVSEDRSCGSGFARLILKAVSNVGKETQTETPEPDELYPDHPLKDYITQLRYLEQQSNKILIAQRKEQDLMRNMDMSTIPTGPLPIEIANGPELNLDLGPASSNSTCRVQQHDADINKLVDQDATLLLSLKLISKALNLQDESTLTMENLQEFTNEFQAKKNLKAKENLKATVIPRSQTIHHVLGVLGDTRMYLDMPQWIEGASSSKEALVGNLPVPNIPAYLSKHPDVCFIIYRDYTTSHPHNDDIEQEQPDTSGAPKHKAETIEFTSKELITAVNRFLEYYGFSGTTEPTKLSAPYFVIYHARDNLNEFLNTMNDELRQQFQVLVDYICAQYAEEYSLVDDMIARGKITNAYIKYLFKPNDVVVKSDGQYAQGYLSKDWLEEPSVPRFHQLAIRRPKNRTYKLTCWNWKFDGVFSREETPLELNYNIENRSEKNIDDLKIRPLRYVNARTVSRLERRGKWIWDCRIRGMVSYDDETELQGSGQGRYMIDMMMYRELHQTESSSRNFTDTNDLGPEALKEDNPPDSRFIYLMPQVIKGYNLKRKKWIDLQVDKIQQVVWNTRAFDSLVMDRKTKRLIRALISNQIEAERSTDLIDGKGNGLILLLHGGPGTGKTLTAESVAEIAQKPLYPVTCGDIGTEPEVVETYLESVLHIGKTWGCVVLLDEADVFLEQRSLEDLRRNALVSVFLRVLEYYDGILILTSNRVGTFDEAFKSRIQLAVHYLNLTLHQRTKIWGNFIGRLEELGEEGIDFDDLHDHVAELASNEMNGREIRNVITTARQYTRWERKQPNQQDFKLDYKVMSEVLQTTRKFNQYTLKMNGGLRDDQIAEEEGLRIANAE